MALVGDLRNIKLADLFQTLSMNQQVGTLVVKTESREKRIYFSPEGVSYISDRTISAFRLGSFLCGAGKITEDDLQVALKKQHETAGAFLGQVIISMGLCSLTDVQDVLRYHAAEELYEIFTWEVGEFEFAEGARLADPDDPAPFANLNFDTGSVVMEAARRIDEWALIRNQFPSDDDFLVRIGAEGDSLDSGVWEHDLATVYALVDGQQSVADIFALNYLSAFDTGTILLELFRKCLIRPATFEELAESARNFLGKKDLDRGTLCLERAHLLKPDDLATIESLADCYERLEETRAAGGMLVRLGKNLTRRGMMAEAVDALEKAGKLDPSSTDVPTLLMFIYRDLGDEEAAAERAATAVEIHCEQKDWDRAIKLSRDVIRRSPEHVGIRISLANALLGIGEREKAIEELEEIAFQLEECKNLRMLPEIYKKILQLDSTRREYLHRLESLQQGRDRRSHIVRMSTLGGAGLAVVLAAVYFFLLKGPGPEAQLEQAWALFKGGQMGDARQLATLVVGENPGSEVEFAARNLLAAIANEESGTGRPENTAETIQNQIALHLTPAETAFSGRRFAEGIEELLKLADLVKSEKFRAELRKLGGQGNKIRIAYEKSVRSLLAEYAVHLEAKRDEEQRLLDRLVEKDLDKSGDAEVQSIYDQADRLRGALSDEKRRETVDTAEVVEVNLCAGRRDMAERLFRVSDEIDGIHERAEGLYHQARALVRRQDMRGLYDEMRRTVTSLKDQGELEKAADQVGIFLRECTRLEQERPTKYYAAVVKDLLTKEGIDLLGKTRSLQNEIEGVLGDIREVEFLIQVGLLAEANERMRFLLVKHFRIDFTRLLRPVILIRSRPLGAEVHSSWNAGPQEPLGVTTEEGLLVRCRPSGMTRIEIRKKTFTTVQIEIADFIRELDSAPVILLKKKAEWTSTGAGSIEATPGIVGETLLVASRDGHLRGYAAATGEIRFDHDSGLLAGLSCTPVVDGVTAYLSSLDQKLLAVQVTDRKVLWSFETEAPLRTPPVVVGGRVVVSDEGGTVYGLEGGKEIWRRVLDGRVYGPPAEFGSDVLVGTTTGQVVCISPADGEIRWTQNVGGPVYAGLEVSADGTVLLGTDASELVALDASNGKVQWRVSADNAVRGAPVCRNGVVHFATFGGTIYRVDLKTGTERGRLTLPEASPVTEGMAVSNGIEYLVDKANTLYAVSPEEGIIWCLPLGERAQSAPLLFGGRIYVTTDAGSIFCFKE